MGPARDCIFLQLARKIGNRRTVTGAVQDVHLRISGKTRDEIRTVAIGTGADEIAHSAPGTCHAMANALPHAGTITCQIEKRWTFADVAPRPPTAFFAIQKATVMGNIPRYIPASVTLSPVLRPSVRRTCS